MAIGFAYWGGRESMVEMMRSGRFSRVPRQTCRCLAAWRAVALDYSWLRYAWVILNHVLMQQGENIRGGDIRNDYCRTADVRQMYSRNIPPCWVFVQSAEEVALFWPDLEAIPAQLAKQGLEVPQVRFGCVRNSRVRHIAWPHVTTFQPIQAEKGASKGEGLLWDCCSTV